MTNKTEELKFAFHFIVTSCKTQPFEDTLANFIIRYRPPYIAQVLEGFDSPTGACSLSLDEIITIHTVVRLKRIKVKNSKGKYFFLPVDNSARVEIVPKTRTRQSKGGLRSNARRAFMITFLRALREIPDLNLEDGDILEPICVNETSRGKKAGPETLTCKILRQPDREIRLPLDYVMPFESFEEFDPRRYSLRYVADNIAFPVAVRFIGDVKVSPEARIALKGEFRFEEIVEESVVIATTKLHDQFTILKLPVDLQVTVFPIRKLRCNAEYIGQYWERLQREIDKLETQITSVEDDLLPTSYFQENALSAGLEGNGDIGNHEAIDVSIVDEYVSTLDGDAHVYEAMGPSFSDRQDQCMQKLERIEDYYEAMEFPTTRKVCEYMPVPGQDENEYVAMETSIARKLGEYHLPLLDAGCEHVYEAMRSSNAHKFPESQPYSSSRSLRCTDSNITRGYGEKSLYPSVASFPQDSELPRRSTGKPKLQDQAERINTEETKLHI